MAAGVLGMAGAARDQSLLEQELQNLRALVKRMLMETDPEKLQALIGESLRLDFRNHGRTKPRGSLF